MPCRLCSNRLGFASILSLSDTIGKTMETLFMFLEWISLLVYDTAMEVLVHALIIVAIMVLLGAVIYKRKND